jgi:hypothetical protein
MIARAAHAIATGPVGRTFSVWRDALRDGPIGRFAASSFFDWVIPGAIVVALIVGAGFLIVGPA